MQSQNQFQQAPVQGQMDLRFNSNIISAQIDAAELGALVPGQAVTLVDSAGGVPKVIAAAADADDVYGFIVYDIKSRTFSAGDMVELAVLHDSVMYMTAGAAIARGANVTIDPVAFKVVTATTGDRIVGKAFDKAAADGDLIRVVIELPGALSA